MQIYGSDIQIQWYQIFCINNSVPYRAGQQQKDGLLFADQSGMSWLSVSTVNILLQMDDIQLCLQLKNKKKNKKKTKNSRKQRKMKYILYEISAAQTTNMYLHIYLVSIVYFYCVAFAFLSISLLSFMCQCFN